MLIPKIRLTFSSVSSTFRVRFGGAEAAGRARSIKVPVARTILPRTQYRSVGGSKRFARFPATDCPRCDFVGPRGHPLQEATVERNQRKTLEVLGARPYRFLVVAG